MVEREKNICSVYIMKSGDEKIKIGVSKNPSTMVNALQTGNANEIVVLYESKGLSNAYQIEGDLHRKFADVRCAGEWFYYSEHIVHEAIVYIEEYGNTILDTNCVISYVHDIAREAAYVAMYELLLEEKENKDIEQLVLDYLFGTRNSALAKLITKSCGEEHFYAVCKVVSGLFDIGKNYDDVVAFIEQNNTKLIAC